MKKIIPRTTKLAKKVGSPTLTSCISAPLGRIFKIQNAKDADRCLDNFPFLKSQKKMHLP